MDFEEMNTRACHREVCPDGLTPAERTAYLTIRLLYEMVGRKSMTRAEAVKLKKQAEGDLDREKAREDEYVRNATIIKLLRHSEDTVVRAALENAERSLEVNCDGR